MPLASDTGIDLPGDAAIPNAEPPPSSYTYRWLAHLADRPLPRRLATAALRPDDYVTATRTCRTCSWCSEGGSRSPTRRGETNG